MLRGHLTIQLRDRDVELSEGELFVVPRVSNTAPKADEEAHVVLIEPQGTDNTGDAGGPLTAEETCTDAAGFEEERRRPAAPPFS